MNARFWLYWNGGWVKLTMKPGQSLSMYTGRVTDEGFCCELQDYSYEGDTVERSITTWGKDCDGQHDVRFP